MNDKRYNKYVTLSRAKITDTRNLVISKNNSVDGFTLGQQVVLKEGIKQTFIFLNGAIHVDNVEGLYALRDALNEAIIKVEANQGR